MSTTIVDVLAREVLDSRNPTVEVEVYLEDGTMGSESFLPALLQEHLKQLN